MSDLYAVDSRAPLRRPTLDEPRVTNTGVARIALDGEVGERGAVRLAAQLRELEQRALLLVLDLSRLEALHHAALAVLAAAGRRAARDHRRVWLVVPDACAGPTDRGPSFVGGADLRRWLGRSGLTLVDAATAQSLGGLASDLAGGAAPAAARESTRVWAIGR